MNLLGITIKPSPLMVETVTEVRSVRGGYLNRWLIRAVVTETRPSRNVIHDRINNVMYAHPDLIAQMLRARSEWL